MHHTPIDPHTYARMHDLAKVQARQLRQQAVAGFWAAAFAAVQGLVTGKARRARAADTTPAPASRAALQSSTGV